MILIKQTSTVINQFKQKWSDFNQIVLIKSEDLRCVIYDRPPRLIVLNILQILFVNIGKVDLFSLFLE